MKTHFLKCKFGLNELPEVRFEFSFMLIGKLTMAFMVTYSNPVTQVGAQNKDVGAALQAELT